jgi:uncharacterized protein
MKSKSILLLLCCSTIIVNAQPTKTSIQVLSKVNKEGVWLRWAPIEFSVWQLGNQHGYVIERFTIQQDGSIDLNAVAKLTTESIKPLTKEGFLKLDATQDNVAAVGELIYTVDEPAKRKEGNSPAEILQKGGDQNNRFGMALLLCDLSYKTAEAAGLFFNDVTAVKGSRYIYKIKLAVDTEKTQAFEPGVIVVDANETPPLKAFDDLRADFRNKTVTLSWPTFTHKGIYGAYIIEKSTDGKTFKSITDLPYISMSESALDEAHFVDSLENNGSTFSYRVKGISPFGEQGPPSNVVKGVGKDDMTGLISIGKIVLDNKTLKVKWDFPESYENKIIGFKISKANKADGAYVDITKKALPKKTREFSFDALAASTYFQVKAVDKEGKEVSVSFPYFYHVEDNTPPAVPSNLTGTINEKGIVTLSWQLNKDADIQGYRLFSSHSLKNEFVEITTRILSTQQFTDTVNLKLLNKQIYYKIVAVDQNYNTSDYSKPLSVSIPDIIAPVAPVFTKVKVNGAAIDVEWVLSSSNDVIKYTLVRSSKVDTAKLLIQSWKKEKGLFENKFSDTNVSLGGTYRYQLTASDSAGNKATVLSKEILYETGIRKDVTEFSATINRDDKTIQLNWAYDTPVKKSIIYRRKNDQSFSLYQSLEGTVNEFSDGLIIINNTYSYKIQLELDNGVKTELSKELKVPF